jgi:hypothetical protein
MVRPAGPETAGPRADRAACAKTNGIFSAVSAPLVLGRKRQDTDRKNAYYDKDNVGHLILLSGSP